MTHLAAVGTFEPGPVPGFGAITALVAKLVAVIALEKVGVLGQVTVSGDMIFRTAFAAGPLLNVWTFFSEVAEFMTYNSRLVDGQKAKGPCRIGLTLVAFHVLSRSRLWTFLRSMAGLVAWMNG